MWFWLLEEKYCALPGFSLKGIFFHYSLCLSSYGKEGDGPSIGHEMEATCREGRNNEIEGAFVFDAHGATASQVAHLGSLSIPTPK